MIMNNEYNYEILVVNGLKQCMKQGINCIMDKDKYRYQTCYQKRDVLPFLFFENK